MDIAFLFYGGLRRFKGLMGCKDQSVGIDLDVSGYAQSGPVKTPAGRPDTGQESPAVCKASGKAVRGREV